MTAVIDLVEIEELVVRPVHGATRPDIVMSLTDAATCGTGITTGGFGCGSPPQTSSNCPTITSRCDDQET